MTIPNSNTKTTNSISHPTNTHRMQFIIVVINMFCCDNYYYRIVDNTRFAYHYWILEKKTRVLLFPYLNWIRLDILIKCYAKNTKDWLR